MGESSRSAGPFLSRDLALASCEETDAKFTHWTIIAAEAWANTTLPTQEINLSMFGYASDGYGIYSMKDAPGKAAERLYGYLTIT